MEVIIITLFGLLLGSFLNVFLFRFQTGRGFWGRSYCARCATTLNWYDLVPVLSFLLLKGRCRFCGVKISMQYPLVELTHAGLYGMVAFYFGFSGTALLLYPIMSVLLFVVVYDMRHTIIPDLASLSLAVLALMYSFLSLPLESFVYGLLSGPFMATPFLLLFLLSKGRWMGLGDAKLAVGCGWLLMAFDPFAAVLLSFWIGAGLSVLLLLLATVFKRLKSTHFPHTMKQEIPFAPYLVLGTLLVLFWDVEFFDLVQWLAF